jgi:putative ABC transport system substrate-binding protein
MMERRTFLAMAAGGLLAAPLAVEAEPVEKIVRIGLLDYGDSNPSTGARWRAFRERLRELGYVEGQNVVFEPRWGDGQAARMPSLAAELVKIKADILVTATSEAAFAAKQATRTIPIVTATTADPVELGLVASLGRPGGNVTGVISLNNNLIGKRLELLKQVIPRDRTRPQRRVCARCCSGWVSAHRRTKNLEIGLELVGSPNVSAG